MKKDFVVVGFAVYKDKVLLVKHKKLKMWLPPGGHIEEGEVPEDAVKRELKEESSLDVEIICEKDFNIEGKRVKALYTPRFIQLEDIDGKHQHIDLIFFCKANTDKLRLKEDEHHDIRWFSEEELDSPEINRNVRYSGKMAINEVKRLK